MSQDRPPSDLTQGQPPPDLPPAPPLDKHCCSIAKASFQTPLGQVLLWSCLIGFCVALVATLVFTRTSQVSLASERTQTINNLSQIAKAAHAAHDV